MNVSTELSQKKSVFDLEFDIISPFQFDQKRSRVESAYQLIKREWSFAFKFLKVDEVITSDDFLRSNIVGLFDGDSAVALMLTYNGSFDHLSFRDQKYFHNYPDSVIHSILKYGRNTKIWYKFTVHREWTRRKTDISVAEVIIGLLIKNFKNEKIDCAIGLARNDVGVNKIAENWGIEILDIKNVYNTKGSFVLLTQSKSYKNIDPDVNLAVQVLFSQKFNNEITRRTINATILSEIN